MCIIKRAARLTPGATARCCAVGSARGLGPRGRRFESCHLDQQRDAAPNSRSSPRWWSRTFLPALAQHLFRRPNSRGRKANFATTSFFACGTKSRRVRRFLAPPSRKKARLLRLLPCKRGRHASAALPTFCGKGPLFLKRCAQFAIIVLAVVANFFARAEALTGELRFCAAKVEFLKLPSPVCPHRRPCLASPSPLPKP